MNDATENPLRAFVRGTWLLLIVQLAVALVVFGALAYASYQLNTILSETRQRQAALAELQFEHDDLQSRITGLAGAYPHLRDGLQAIGQGDWAAARRAFEDADKLSPNEALILRPLSEAQAKLEDFQAAVATRQRAFDMSMALPSEHVVDTIYLARFKCRAGDAEGARALLTDAFLTTNAEAMLSHADDLRQDCPSAIGTLVAAAQPAAPAVEQVFVIRDVFLHINSEEDRARAIGIAEGICRAGYNVPGIEFVPTQSYPAGGDVRYYYEQQAAAARRIAALARGIAQAQRIDLNLRAPRIVSGFQSLPRNRIEIWFPPSSNTGAAVSADRSFSCTPEVSGSAQAFYELSVVRMLEGRAGDAVLFADRAVERDRANGAFRRQACLARIRFWLELRAEGRVGAQDYCAVQTRGTPSENAETYLNQGMYQLRLTFIARGGDQVRAWASAREAFQTGLRVLGDANRIPGGSALRARLARGNNDAAYCLGVGSLTDLQADLGNVEDAANAGRFFNTYGLANADGSTHCSARRN